MFELHSCDLIQAEIPGIDLAQFEEQIEERTAGGSMDAKLRGGYYTPDAIAAYLAKWSIRSADALVLEPSAGDGRVVAAAHQHLSRGGHVTAVELFASEARKIPRRGVGRTTVVTGDVFAWYKRQAPKPMFDAVIGNPPFIRYQNFPDQHRQPAFTLMEEEGLHPSRLTNAWVPFLVLATRVLKHGARLALVLPGELLQVSYAAELREYLARKYAHLNIITFRRLVFPGIQQETILLLGERRDSSAARISVSQVDSIEDLRRDRIREGRRVPVDLNHAREKWTQYYLSPKELGLIRSMEQTNALTTLGAMASVDVGVVTGRNEFFVLSDAEARERSLTRWCIPLVGRSAQIPGLCLTDRDWQNLVADGQKCLLLHVGDVEREALPVAVAQYVRSAERRGLHKGYKCRIRLPNWWRVPSVWAPDAFLLRQIHDAPRIIENRSGATCTDTIHRIRMTDGVSPASLAAASMNSLTFAFSEIRGRSYGGGVLELEPTEAEGLPFPRLESELPLHELDRWAKKKSRDRVLQEVDRLVLEPAGLSRTDTRMLLDIWKKLSSLRLNRTRRPTAQASLSS